MNDRFQGGRSASATTAKSNESEAFGTLNGTITTYQVLAAIDPTSFSFRIFGDPTMRLLAAFLAATLVITPAIARDSAPYYGPKDGALGEGYKEKLQKDGSWRIVTEYHTRDPLIALDVALYRAAHLARIAGKPYVEVLSGDASASNYSVATGFVFARPVDSSAAPMSCRAKRCYTADVAKVLRELSGAGGNQPGVPIATIDQYGRQVSTSGYGTGAVAWAEK